MRTLAVLAALVVFVAALVAGAPATLLDGRIERASNGALRLADADGTVWRGGGTLAAPDGRWTLPLGWHLEPWPLLGGAARVTLVPADDATATGTLDVRNEVLQADNLHLAFPAMALSSLAPARTPVVLGGRLDVAAPSLRVSPDAVRGQFTARWDDARLAWGGLALDLGTVEARGEPAANGMRVRLSGRGGDAALEGSVLLNGTSVALDATVTPAHLSAAVALALRALGSPTPEGGVHLAWQTRW